MSGPIRIVRSEIQATQGRVKRVAYWYSYALKDSGKFLDVPGRAPVECTYAGTPLASLRGIAKRLATEQGRTVVEDF